MRASLVVEDLALDVETDHGPTRVVDGVGFAVHPGECVALVGESGAGKTLTARAVLGLLPDRVTRAGGTVRWNGRDLAREAPRRRRRILGAEIAYVPQEPALDPAMRVGNQLAEAMRAHGVPATDARRRVPRLLEAVGISDGERRRRAYPHELSGGMCQRIMLALALANEPQLVVADEPTTALDVLTQARILELIARLRREEGHSLLLVTHDLGVVAGVADRVLVMYAGAIVEAAATEVLFERPRHPYTAALLDALPRLGDARGSLRAIAGSAPRAGARPVGCAFHPRCPYSEPGCAQVRPSLEPVDGGTDVACLRSEELGVLKGGTPNMSETT